LLASSIGGAGWTLETAQATESSPQVSLSPDATIVSTAEGISGVPTEDSLLDMARKEGSLLVLAELALPAPFAAEAESSPQAVLDQRAAIASALDFYLPSPGA
jgi:hypothetical protein